MNKKAILVLVTACMLVYSVGIFPVKSQNSPLGYILIKQDGTVEPSSAPIQRAENVYTFTKNINKPIVIERNNITLDGTGHWLQRSTNAPNITGIDSGVGINLTSSYVTIRNVTISNWNTGVLGVYDNNNIIQTSIFRCSVGIKVYGNNYNIEWNYIANNEFKGIMLRANRAGISHNEIAGDQDGIDIFYSDHVIMENNMSNTGYDITGMGKSNVYIFRNNFFKTNLNRYLLALGGDATWESGGEGNYWKAYNGTDANGDGIGDEPFPLGQFFASGSRIWDTDYRPLMKPVAIQKPPQPSPTPTPNPTLTPMPKSTQTPPTPTQTLTPTVTPALEPSLTPQQTPTLYEQPKDAFLITEVLLYVLTFTMVIMAIVIVFLKRTSKKIRSR